MDTVFIVAGSLALLLSLLLLYSYLTSPPRHTRARGRDPRRGGYIKLSASPGPNLTTIRMNRATPFHAGSTSSCTAPGDPSEVWAIPRALHDPSRITGRGWSTVGTEALGASGVRRTDADWHKGIGALALRGPATSLSPYVWP